MIQLNWNKYLREQLINVTKLFDILMSEENDKMHIKTDAALQQWVMEVQFFQCKKKKNVSSKIVI